MSSESRFNGPLFEKAPISEAYNPSLAFGLEHGHYFYPGSQDAVRALVDEGVEAAETMLREIKWWDRGVLTPEVFLSPEISVNYQSGRLDATARALSELLSISTDPETKGTKTTPDDWGDILRMEARIRIRASEGDTEDI